MAEPFTRSWEDVPTPTVRSDTAGLRRGKWCVRSTTGDSSLPAGVARRFGGSRCIGLIARFEGTKCGWRFDRDGFDSERVQSSDGNLTSRLSILGAEPPSRGSRQEPPLARDLGLGNGHDRLRGDWGGTPSPHGWGESTSRRFVSPKLSIFSSADPTLRRSRPRLSPSDFAIAIRQASRRFSTAPRRRRETRST